MTVERAATGPVREENARYVGPADGERRPPSAIPECDVLELDCEGAELDILRTLDGDPRVIIVEIHPRVGCPAPEVEAAFAEMGYAIIERGPPGGDGDLPVVTAGGGRSSGPHAVLSSIRTGPESM